MTLLAFFMLVVAIVAKPPAARLIPRWTWPSALIIGAFCSISVFSTAADKGSNHWWIILAAYIALFAVALFAPKRVAGSGRGLSSVGHDGRLNNYDEDAER